MKFLIYIFFLVFILCSCSKEIDQGEVAARVAKQYYDTLLEGNYEAFVDGTYKQDSIPKRYKELLIDNAKMFIEQQQDEHKGIKEVRIIRYKADTVAKTADVFLLFVYGDSTSEQTIIPMIKSKGNWMMK